MENHFLACAAVKWTATLFHLGPRCFHLPLLEKPAYKTYAKLLWVYILLNFSEDSHCGLSVWRKKKKSQSIR